MGYQEVFKVSILLMLFVVHVVMLLLDRDGIFYVGVIVECLRRRFFIDTVPPLRFPALLLFPISKEVHQR